MWLQPPLVSSSMNEGSERKPAQTITRIDKPVRKFNSNKLIGVTVVPASHTEIAEILLGWVQTTRQVDPIPRLIASSRINCGTWGPRTAWLLLETDHARWVSGGSVLMRLAAACLWSIPSISSAVCKRVVRLVGVFFGFFNVLLVFRSFSRSNSP